MNSPRQFLSTIRLVKDIMGQRLEVGQVRAVESSSVRFNMVQSTYFRRALLNLLKSECLGLSTSAIPHGYILARTG